MLTTLLLCSLAFGQELYAPAPPPDAAFVRVAHADPAETEGVPGVGDQKFSPVGFQQVTPYQPVTKGERDASLGKRTAALQIEAGEYYTVALVDGELHMLQDTRSGNLAKAMVLLYNLTDQPGARLTTGDGGTEVIADVGPLAEGSRAVNALTTDLAVWLGSVRVDTFEAVTLERGRAYSAIVTQDVGGPRATWVVNATR